MVFSTKSDTLKQLEGQLTTGRVLPQVSFTVQEWIEERSRLIQTLSENIARWDNPSVIVRSSALTEDSHTESKAGKFLSILHVSGEKALQSAIEEVISSYDEENPENQVLIQPMLEEIQVSGVIFSVDPQNNSPYFVINYDDTTGSSDSVTSGQGQNLKTCYLFQGASTDHPVISMCQKVTLELIALFQHNKIDIEFAISNGVFYVLQVRALVVPEEVTEISSLALVLGEIHDYIKNAMKKKPYLYGDTTIFGVMPDWNPAEIIGLHPKPLALSLYKYLITDGVWAYQRDNYGYKNLRSFPLMLDFSGLPYIDTRVSFNSFIPKEIDHELSDKLTNYYLKKLREEPNQQDKVEFNIILSCYTFDLEKKFHILKENGFSLEECTQIKEALLSLTNRISHMENGLWKKDIEKIDELEQRYQEISNSDLTTLEKIYWLLEYCSRYGTLPFAGLARVGFIAVLLLRSMVTEELLSEEDYQRFMSSLNTVSSQMSSDYEDLSRKAFLKRYGHLRPGTYDILSKRYDVAPELYFSSKQPPIEPEKPEEFKLSLAQYEKIQRLMDEQGLEQDVLSLFQFIKMGIEQREYSKFIFSKSLSLSLELITTLGEENGFTPEEMAFFDVQSVKSLYSKSGNIQEEIRDSIQKGRKKFENSVKITLPPVIVSPEDVYCFHLSPVSPNYITQKTTTASVVVVDLQGENITGKILLIPSADPGFDWIFSHKIAGFVTAYGGVNSHMAIRANELAVPAVIGVGAQKFQQLSLCSLLKIDCQNKKMEILS